MQELLASVGSLSSKERKALATLLKRQGINLYNVAPIFKRHSEEPAVLSYAQQRLWFFWQLDPDNTAFNIPAALQLQGPLDIEVLRHSFQALISRHESLRTTFTQAQDQAVQVIHPAGPFSLHVENAEGLPPAEQRVQIDGFVERLASQPFDLEHGPLLRVSLLKLAEDDHVLVVAMHHIVSDGWSVPIMIEELIALYQAQLRGVEATLPALSVQYADYAAWQRQWMEAGEQERQLAYWQTQLGGEQPVLQLPADRPRSAVQNQAGADHEIPIDAALAHQLKQLAIRENCTLFMVLLASFQALLYRYSGQPQIRVGVPVANRTRAEAERLIGFFVNTQVLQAQLHSQMPFKELLAQVKACALGAQAHQDLPFEQLVEALQPERSLSHSPLFQVMLNHQYEEAGVAPAIDGLKVKNLTWKRQTAQYELTLNTLEQPQGLSATLSYATALFDAATVERISGHWLNLLHAVCRNPAQAIGESPLLSPGELQTLLHDFNRSHYTGGHGDFVQQTLEAQARHTPDAVALLFGTQSMSYAELNRRANRLAHKLVELGVKPEVLVGIALERSMDMVIGLLAILKAGGAYVPMDPQYPRDRLAFMIEDSAIQLLLTQHHLLDVLPIPDGVSSLILDQDSDWLEAYGDDNLPCRVEPEHLAYMIYTSGSTGRPKAVCVAHGPLTMHCQAIGQLYGMTAQDCELHFMSFAFDGAHERWLTTLTHGGRLLIRDNSLWSVEQTYAALHEHQVSVVAFPPVYLQQLAEYAEQFPEPPPVRIYCFGGDAVPNASFELVKRVLRPHFIINGYGPTETVVTPLIWKAGRDESCQAAYAPIGKIVGTRTAYVLDSDLNPVPLGSAGELYLGGEGLARGYYQRPDITAERFVADPFSHGGRLYRSGDLVRLRADGVTEYLGRVDHQVKIRGYRIELGEIEARLQDHPAVGEAVVLAMDGPTGRQLVGYILPLDPSRSHANAKDQELLRTEIKDHLKACLPDYMLPKHLVLLDSLPLTPNGKLDRKALPAPDLSVTQHTYVAPQTDTQQRLANIWQDVLKVEQVGLTDNFFELGGDSIVSIQVVSRARQAGIRLTPKDVFQHQTILGLAGVAQAIDTRVLDQGPVQGASPLTPVQHVFFAEAVPERQHWNQSILLIPSQPVDADALSQALEHLLRHHDALRLGFTAQSGQWQAAHRPITTAGQPLLWQRQATDSQALLDACNEAQRSLNLEQGPLLRALLVNVEDGSQRLLLTVHHLVVDGVSWRILLEDLQTCYSALLQGHAPKLPDKTSAFKAWAEHLQTYARGTALQEQLHYWQTQLQDASDALPGARRNASLAGNQGQFVSTQLDPQLTRQLLQEAPAAYRTQVNDLLMTALARVICRWTKAPSALIQLEGHGREDLFNALDLTRTVGWFTSVFPVKLTPGVQLSDSIKAIKEQLRNLPDKGIGYGALRFLGDPQTQQTLRALPTARITFNYLGQFDQSFDEHALFSPAPEDSGDNQDPSAPLDNWLSINGQVYGGQLQLNWTFSRDMFDASCIQQLADDYRDELHALINHCLSPQAGAVTPSDFPLANISQGQLDALAVDARQLDDLYPLSPMQQGMLFHSVYEDRGDTYVNQLAVDIDGLDAPGFIRAWQTVIERHDILRSGFLWEDGLVQPLQCVHKHLTLPVRELDWRNQALTQSALEDLAQADREQGFDLQQAPLLRVTLVRLDERAYHLIYTSHHILMDGWSNSQLMGEVLQAYAHQPLAPLTGRFKDYISWLQRQDRAASQAFWSEQLQHLTEPTRVANAFGGRHQKGAVAQGHGVHLHTLGTDRTQALEAFARDHKVTLNSVVQAAWLLLLARYSGQDTVAFGATVAGRPADLPGVESQLGLFINTLPIVATPQPNQSVSHWLAQIQAQNLNLREHEHTPLHEIQHMSPLGAQALFDNILVFENFPVAEALQQAAPGELVFGEVKDFEHTNYPLTIAVSLGDTLSLSFEYALADFAPTTVQHMAEHLDTLLQRMQAHPDHALGQLQVLSDERQRGLISHAEGGVIDATAQQCAHQLIEAQAAKTPDAVAIVLDDQQLTYGALNAWANQLAGKLRACGAGPDQLVGLAVERSLDMAVGLLAILKSGAGYVPLDPTYPQDRLSYMLADSGLKLLLIEDSLLAHLPVPASIHTLNLTDGLADFDVENLPHQVTAQNLAYVIYTSGSTGQPKGVAITHGALTEFCGIAGDYSQLCADDRVLQFATFSFDGFIEQFYPPLCRGARVILRGPSVWDTTTFYEQILHHGISIADLPSAYWHLFAMDCAAAGPRTYGQLRQIHVGGEAMSVEGLRHWQAAGLGSVRLLNTYGPTEATVVSSTLECSNLDPDTLSEHGIPIGRALPGRSLYVMDNAFCAAPRGTVGELYIGGAVGQARAYHQRPALSAERFVPNPFVVGGERLYRTGDLARYNAEGNVEYVGRIDHQVKIRGFRIELGEVETCLQGCEGVREAVVIATDGPTGKQLVGYVVATVAAQAMGQRALLAALRSHLKDQLPAYMAPGHWVILDRLPLTPNGKLDRKALPPPQDVLSTAPTAAPRTALEQQMARIWQTVLNVDAVGLHDNFFELGGHSLLVLQAVSLINQTYGTRLSLHDFMGYPNLETLCQNLQTPSAQLAVRLNQHQGPQAPLFCFHPIFGMVHSYQPLAVALREQAPVYGVLCKAFIDGAWHDISWADMIELYVANIRNVQPQGPYSLAGWSLGGNLAMEVAHRLEAAGETVAFLGLIDTPPPASVEVFWKTVQAQSGASAAPTRNALELFKRLFPAQAQTAEAHYQQLPALEKQARFIDWAKIQLKDSPEHLASLLLGERELALGEVVSQKLDVLAQDFRYRPLNVPLHCWWAGQDKFPALVNLLEEQLKAAFGEKCLALSMTLACDHEAIVTEPLLVQSLSQSFLGAR